MLRVHLKDFLKSTEDTSIETGGIVEARDTVQRQNTPLEPFGLKLCTKKSERYQDI